MDSPLTSGLRRSEESLWAITSYFNPVGYRRRLANYRVFRERLTVPLVAVELAYGPAFELRERDADILVQLRGGDVMWQKERLLNVALAALPSTCRKVTWLDCDVIFEADDWPERVNRLLDSFKLVQPFRQVHYLPRDWLPGEIRTTEAEFARTSAAFAIASGVSAAVCIGHRTEAREGTSAPGSHGPHAASCSTNMAFTMAASSAPETGQWPAPLTAASTNSCAASS